MVIERLEALELFRFRAVVFDFGGVLAEEGFRRGLEEIARRRGLDPEAFYRIGKDAVYDSGFVTGRGSEKDFWDLVRLRSGAEGEDAVLSREILSRFAPRPRMIEAVRTLRMNGFRTALLSDQTDWLDRLEARYHFFKEFDRVYNSYHVGKGKRDPTVFDDVVRDLGVEARETLFVDDQEENAVRAEERGLKALLFRDEESFLPAVGGLLSRGRRAAAP
jgi:putative hydrolase of the HAD superfamily